MERKIVQLAYDHKTARVVAGDEELHCGDCFDALIVNDKGNPEWVPTRLEMKSGYYLVDLPGISPIGIFARF